MNDRDVAAIVRGVLVDRGFPYAVVSVAASASGWDIRLQGQGGGIRSISIPDGRPVFVRVAFQERLEAQA